MVMTRTRTLNSIMAWQEFEEGSLIKSLLGYHLTKKPVTRGQLLVPGIAPPCMSCVGEGLTFGTCEGEYVDLIS
jgi:hypothetical protein